MRSRQRGATHRHVGIVAILGFALYGGIRLSPVYMEYMAVARALDQTAKEHRSNPTSPAGAAAFERRWTSRTSRA